jgi:Tfp pilus assembly protein PilF
MQSSDHADTLLRRARLCMRAGEYADAAYWLRRYLAAPDCVWADERCDAMLALARCHMRMQNRAEAERWILRACAEAADRPEPWREAAAFYEPVSAQAAEVCRSRAEASKK